jgi:hypothetical protein
MSTTKVKQGKRHNVQAEIFYAVKVKQNPQNSDVDLSSNSLHISEIMAVDEDLFGQRYNYWFF